MSVPAKRALALLCAPLLAVGLSACAQTVSTSGLKGESKNVGEAIKNLETDVTAGEQTKICKNDLSSALVAQLNNSTGGCTQAIKGQLAEVDSFELTIQSVSATPPSATARVESVYSGKKRISTVSLVKQGGKWKISALN